VVPKADAATLPEVAAALPGRHLIALLETVKGWMELDRLAAVPGLSRIAFGSIDFALETGIVDEGDAMTSIRTRIVLASCHAGLAAPVDGVSVEVNDEALMRRHALRSLQLGFGGKLCIHPRQVAAVNAAFRPEPSQVDWALRVLAAFEASGGAATAVDGKMVDKPVVEQARRIAAEGSGR
jgi:citrate lyase subunit beta/citryl-CoA lyase